MLRLVVMQNCKIVTTPGNEIENSRVSSYCIVRDDIKREYLAKF
jgi:hypothetical protein